MIQVNIDNSPVRSVKGKVELYEGSTLLNTFTYRDRLKSFTVERVGEDSKFFGFGVCQKINIKLIDKDRELEITTANSFKAFLTTGEDYLNPFPLFYVTEVHRDENTNELSITAYDLLYKASEIIYTPDAQVEKLIEEGIWAEGNYDYTLNYYTYLAAYQLGLTTRYITLMGITLPMPPVEVVGMTVEGSAFELSYAEGANLEGSETIRDILDDIAEATQTIYYVDIVSGYQTIKFKRLDKDGEAVLTITKNDYFSLDSRNGKRLGAICHTTELGDNIEAKLAVSGSTQYVRNNVFWEMREDIDTLVEDALAAIGNITIRQFDCSWRGNYLLEIGDKIKLRTKDNSATLSYLLNDTLEYDGSLSQKTRWNYEDNNTDTPANSSSLGEVLKQTYARVDKANKEITILASDISADRENISALQVTTDGIAGRVTSVEETTAEALTGVTDDVAELKNTVETKLTDEEVTIKITEALSNGVDKVETSTGFTFNEEGLTVSKSDSEMSTTITEDGMQVFKNGEAVLTANNIGVDAKNLHATTYLIIGTNSRFEDYGNRTGCFWIGG